jgi:hypothetical protein
MKKRILVLSFTFLILQSSFNSLPAQCSICTKTVQQMGEKPAQGLNAGILYLAAAPFIIAGFIYYRMKRNSPKE